MLIPFTLARLKRWHRDDDVPGWTFPVLPVAVAIVVVLNVVATAGMLISLD